MYDSTKSLKQSPRMSELIPVITKDEIEKVVNRLALEISSDYLRRDLILIAVLKGAFIFLSDLVRKMTQSVKIEFIQPSSYGDDTASSGQICLKKGIEINIKGSDVLVIEDIVDTGLTAAYLIDYLKSLGPNTVKICALLDKHERRKTDIQIDYVGCQVEDGFLVGYGLDYAECYRNLPEICKLQL
jgi:hypoxanthine phosphoribosyltransferase